jgi:ABC-type transporter Mla subunit MlaD
MNTEERLTRLEGIVEKLANNMTTFIQSATEFNATTTSAIGTLSQAVGTMSQAIGTISQAIGKLADRQAETEAALRSLTESIDRFIRGQGPKDGHEK